MWFIAVEVEQETSAPPPKKNPGSAPDIVSRCRWFFFSNRSYSANCVVFADYTGSLDDGTWYTAKVEVKLRRKEMKHTK